MAQNAALVAADTAAQRVLKIVLVIYRQSLGLVISTIQITRFMQTFLAVTERHKRLSYTNYNASKLLQI